MPKLFTSGKSFKTLAAYLLHDAEKAATSERVLWTHTLNLASDDPGLAVHEMLWSYRAADDLKRHAGIKAGGRRLENPVRHLSLNWHPSEKPSRDHMIETVESFLAHMGWQEHQALIVCHDDKHPHVHVMLNSVHPETGRALDASFEKRRAQTWALAYEREHALIFCEERLKPAEERTPSPTRETWQKLRDYEQENDKAEAERYAPDYFERHNTGGRAAREWEALKSFQHEQRDQFFAGGKQAYREVCKAAYREVRAEMREQWRDYYQAERDGMAAEYLAAMKADLLAQQSKLLDARRLEACAALREQRDKVYAALKAQHRDQRRQLKDRQEQGRPSHDLFDILYRSASDDGRTEKDRHRSSREEHLPSAGARAPSPTRIARTKLGAYEPGATAGRQHENKQRNYFDRHDRRNRNRQEWKALKAHQREQGDAFFLSGKRVFREARRSAYREVHAELRSAWRKYRQARTAGLKKTQLAPIRAILINRQKEMSNLRAQAERRWLRHCRDKELTALRERHKAQRNNLRLRQHRGLPTHRLLDELYSGAQDGMRKQLRVDAARRCATQITAKAREKEKANWKEWRDRAAQAPTGPNDQAWKRTVTALRSAAESTRKVREIEAGTRKAWARVRPARGRGRD